MSEFQDKLDTFTAPLTDAIKNEEGYIPEQHNHIVEEDSSETEPEQEIEASEAPRKKEGKKHNNTYAKRIGQMTAINHDLVSQNMEKDAIIAQQNERLREAQRLIQLKDKESSLYYDSSLTAEESAVRADLRKAKEEGDYDQEIDLTARLGKIQARKEAYELVKRQQQTAAAHVPYEDPFMVNQRQQYNPAPPPPVNEEYLEWVENNSWYEENPQLRAEADQIAANLANVLTFNNEKHLIGTNQFREYVAAEMRNKYGIRNESQAPEEEEAEEHYSRPERQRSPVVAPVTRRGAPSMAEQYISKNNRNAKPLSQEEYAAAIHLSGTDPRTGKYITEAEAVARYQRNKLYPKSPHGSGSEARFTVVDM